MMASGMSREKGGREALRCPHREGNAGAFWNISRGILFLPKNEGPETQARPVAISLKSITESFPGCMEPVSADNKIQVHVSLTEDKVRGQSDKTATKWFGTSSKKRCKERSALVDTSTVTMEKAETRQDTLLCNRAKIPGIRDPQGTEQGPRHVNVYTASDSKPQQAHRRYGHRSDPWSSISLSSIMARSPSQAANISARRSS